jgi:hypothetical protein
MLKSIKFELPNEEARALIIKGKIPPRLPVVERFAEGQPFSDEIYLEASKLIEGFSGREIRNAVLDLLLKKAQPEGNVVFSKEDLFDVFRKKKEEKDRLENERKLLVKEKIRNKLMEVSEEEKAKEELESEKKKEDVLDENKSSEFKPDDVEEKMNIKN